MLVEAKFEFRVENLQTASATREMDGMQELEREQSITELMKMELRDCIKKRGLFSVDKQMTVVKLKKNLDILKKVSGCGN